MWLLPLFYLMAMKLCHVQRDLQLACQPGFAPQGDFLIGQKVTKDPPKAGPSPALWNPPRGTGWRVHLPFSALGPVGPHRCPGSSTEVGYFCGSLCAYLTLVRRCSQRWAAWLPAAGTPLLQGRPGHRNHPAIGPAVQGGLVWWQYQGPQQGSRANHSLDAWTASYPREVLRGERPKRVLVTFARTKVTPAERPRRGHWFPPRKSEKNNPSVCLTTDSSPCTGEPLGEGYYTREAFP